MGSTIYFAELSVKIKIILFFLLISLPLFSQEMLVRYEPLQQKIFAGGKKPISIALMDFDNDKLTNSIADQLFNYTSKNDEFLNNFIIFPEKTIREQLNLSKININDNKTRKLLKEILGINYVINGDVKDYDQSVFNLKIIRLSNGKEIFNCEFRNSNTSSAFADVINLFMNEQAPDYIPMALLKLNIEPSDAVVEIDSNNYANINEIYVTPGIHKIEILKEGYNTKADSIKVQSAEIIQKKYKLSLIVGSLKINTNQVLAGVKIVRVDSTIKSGESNLLITDIPVGKYKIECTAKGYENYTSDIVIKQNELTDVNVKLIKKKLRIDTVICSNPDVTDLTFDQTNNGVSIHYDLKGENDKDYDVDLFLQLKGQEEELRLEKVIGDVGEGKFAGVKKNILWDMHNEIGNRYSGLEGVLNLKVEKSQGGISWIIYTIGAAVAGGVAAVLTLGKKADGGTTQTPIGAPPPRPQQ